MPLWSWVPVFVVLAAGSSLAAGAPVEEALVSGEIEALRTVLDAELEEAKLDRVEVGRFLLVRWDSRRERRASLEQVVESIPATTPEMIASFRERNTSKLKLWPAARKSLGERAERNAFLLADPAGVHVQFARVGWDASREKGLVYLELRPREGSEVVRAVFRMVQHTAEGWQIEPGRTGFERGRFSLPRQ